MLDESQLKIAERIFEQRYDEYLVDKKKLESDREKYLVDKEKLGKREVALGIREETLAKGEEAFKDKQHTLSVQEKDIKADKKWIKVRNDSLNKEKKEAQRQRDSLEEEKKIFAQEKKEEEAKFLEGATKNIEDLEKNEAQKEKIETWLEESGFYGDSIENSLKNLRKEINDAQKRRKSLEKIKSEIIESEKKKEKLNKEISELNKEKNETKRIIEFGNKEKKQASLKHAVSFSDFKNELELVKHIKKYIASRGFYYEDGIIENFYTSLKVGYLVILSGISGVGKSKLPKLFAEAIGAGFEMIPVRPDWNDDRDLLGFFNINTRQYQTTRFIEFLIEANQNQDRLYIACLDEMNLAPVEYYFAQLLSQMENDEPRLNPPDETFTEDLLKEIEGEITLEWMRLDQELENEKNDISQEVIKERIKQLEVGLERLPLYQNIPISLNVKFVGTVNMDHTTKGFSDKVLDRANVIQFENINIWSELPKKVNSTAKGLNFEQFDGFSKSGKKSQTLQNFTNDLKKISDILQGSGVNIGFRVKNSIEEYMDLAIQGKYFSNNKIIFDSQIKQRILPKIQGMKSEELLETLGKLKKFFEKKEYASSLHKIAGMEIDGKREGGMMRQLNQKGYVNYWELK